MKGESVSHDQTRDTDVTRKRLPLVVLCVKGGSVSQSGNMPVPNNDRACEGGEPVPVPFVKALWGWTKVALNSLGGPAGQIAVM